MSIILQLSRTHWRFWCEMENLCPKKVHWPIGYNTLSRSLSSGLISSILQLITVGKKWLDRWRLNYWLIIWAIFAILSIPCGNINFSHLKFYLALGRFSSFIRSRWEHITNERRKKSCVSFQVCLSKLFAPVSSIMFLSLHIVFASN